MTPESSNRPCRGADGAKFAYVLRSDEKPSGMDSVETAREIRQAKKGSWEKLQAIRRNEIAQGCDKRGKELFGTEDSRRPADAAAAARLVYHTKSPDFIKKDDKRELTPEGVANLCDHVRFFNDREVCGIWRFRRDWKVEKQKAASDERPDRNREDGKPYGPKTHHTQRSRLEMVHFMKNCPVDFRSMLTLTMPGRFVKDGKIVKKMLRVFSEWLRSKGFRGVWFLEFQTRGAPHFHIMLDLDLEKLGPLEEVKRRKPLRPYLTNKEMQARCARHWAKIVDGKAALVFVDEVGNSDESEEDREKRRLKNERSGCSLEHIESEEGALHYAAMHANKGKQKNVPEGYQNCGNFWGKIGLGPLDDGEFFPMTTEQIFALYGPDAISSQGRIKKFLYDAESKIKKI